MTTRGYQCSYGLNRPYHDATSSDSSDEEVCSGKYPSTPPSEEDGAYKSLPKRQAPRSRKSTPVEVKHEGYLLHKITPCKGAKATWAKVGKRIIPSDSDTLYARAMEHRRKTRIGPVTYFQRLSPNQQGVINLIVAQKNLEEHDENAAWILFDVAKIEKTVRLDFLRSGRETVALRVILRRQDKSLTQSADMNTSSVNPMYGKFDVIDLAEPFKEKKECRKDEKNKYDRLGDLLDDDKPHFNFPPPPRQPLRRDIGSRPTDQERTSRPSRSRRSAWKLPEKSSSIEEKHDQITQRRGDCQRLPSPRGSAQLGQSILPDGHQLLRPPPPPQVPHDHGMYHYVQEYGRDPPPQDTHGSPPPLIELPAVSSPRSTSPAGEAHLLDTSAQVPSHVVNLARDPYMWQGIPYASSAVRQDGKNFISYRDPGDRWDIAELAAISTPIAADNIKMRHQVDGHVDYDVPDISTVERGEAAVTSRLPTKACFFLIPLSFLFFGGSLAFGIYWSVAKGEMGDGFTTAAFILCVGAVFVIGPWSAAHWAACTCWSRWKLRKRSE